MIDAARQQLLLAEVGDSPDGNLAGVLPVLWDAEAALAGSPEALYLAVKARAIDIRIADILSRIGRSMDENERKTLQLTLDNLVRMRAAVVLDRQSSQVLASEGRAPVVGRLLTTAPVVSPPGQPDANSLDYDGNPNTRMRRVQ